MLKKLFPVVILIALLATAWVVKNNPPEVKRFKKKDQAEMLVQTKSLKTQDYLVKIRRIAQVQSAVDSQLVAEVGGRIVEVSEKFNVGGQFKQGEVLLRLDDRDYQNDLAISRASLTEAEQTLIEEEAQGEQAAKAWELSGRTGTPDARVLRIPQLKAAKAKVISAKANVNKSLLKLQHTSIQAPFDGFIVEQSVNIGQVVSAGATLAQLKTTQFPELRIALNQRELAFISLPSESAPGADIEILGPLTNKPLKAVSKIIRTETQLNTATQQLMVLARIDSADEDLTLTAGQYVESIIIGNVLTGVLVIPNSSLYQGSYVYVVEDGVLQRKSVDLVWQDEDNSVIRTGLKSGDALVITPMGQVISGTPVRIQSMDADAVNTTNAETRS